MLSTVVTNFYIKINCKPKFYVNNPDVKTRRKLKSKLKILGFYYVCNIGWKLKFLM